MNNIIRKRNIVELFHLFLVNFTVATQFAITVFLFANADDFEINLIFKTFVFFIILPLFVFVPFLEIFNNFQGTRKFFQQGLIFLLLGNLIALFSDINDLLIFAMAISGLGGGMIIFGQLNLSGNIEFKKGKQLLSFLIMALVLGIFVGPYLIFFLSGPKLDILEVFSLLGSVIAMLAFLELSHAYAKIEIFLKNVFSRILEKRKKLAIIGLGIVVNNIIIDYLFDYVLYPVVIWKMGIIAGGIVMMLLSALACYLTLLFYDWSKKDWLGIETIKELTDYQGKTLIGRLTSWILKKGEFAIFIFLSIKFDPFITTVYMRHGSHKYNGMSKRDWKNFFGSTIIANIYWTIVAFIGVSMIEYVVRMF